MIQELVSLINNSSYCQAWSPKITSILSLFEHPTK